MIFTFVYFKEQRNKSKILLFLSVRGAIVELNKLRKMKIKIFSDKCNF